MGRCQHFSSLPSRARGYLFWLEDVPVLSLLPPPLQGSSSDTAVIGLISRWRSGRNVLINILAGIVGGILVNYACGIAGMMIVGHVSFTAALVTLPAYLPGDLLKIVVAASVTAAQLKALPHIRPAKTQDDQAQSALDQIDSPEHNAAVTDSPIINTANTVNIPDSSNSSGNIDKTASTDKEYTSHD